MRGNNYAPYIDGRELALRCVQKATRLALTQKATTEARGGFGKGDSSNFYDITLDESRHVEENALWLLQRYFQESSDAGRPELT